MKTEILDASLVFIEQAFLKPLKLSSGLITQATEARVEVTVQVGATKLLDAVRFT